MSDPITSTAGPIVAVVPQDPRAVWLEDAVRAGHGTIGAPEDADALVWTTPRHPERLATLLESLPRIRWVQLPFAGVDNFRHLVDDGRQWTCAKGVYSEPVAELALTLLLAGFRGIGTYARRSRWNAKDANAIGTNLGGAKITVLGAGGITRSFLRLAKPFGVEATVVRRRLDGAPIDGASRIVASSDLDHALRDAGAVVLALPLVTDTVGIINSRTLALLSPNTWIVNVARGGHIVTDDLVEALRDRRIGGAALDVTDPEPLPDGHPLWGLDNVIITPHVGNTPAMAVPLLSERVSENVRRWSSGEPLIGMVDPLLGY